jgi:hypothetical protein
MISIHLLTIEFRLKHICLQLACTRMVVRMRHEYLRSIMRQDAAWFDTKTSGVFTTGLNEYAISVSHIRPGV